MDFKLLIDTGWITVMVEAMAAIVLEIRDVIRVAQGKPAQCEILVKEIAATGLAGGVLVTIVELVLESAGLI